MSFFDYDVTGSREVTQSSSSARSEEGKKSKSTPPVVKANPNPKVDRVEVSGGENTKTDVKSSAERDNSAKIVQDKERAEMYKLRNAIKQKILENIDKLVALDTGDEKTRAQYRTELKSMINAAVQMRVASVKTDVSVTTSEQRVIDTLMLGASKFDSEETLEKLREQFKEMFYGLSEKEHAKYSGVRSDNEYNKYMGYDAPEKLVRYMVKQQYGDYSSGKSDKLESLVDALIDKYTKQALQGKDEPIDISQIQDYETKEMYRRLSEKNEKQKDDSIKERVPRNLEIGGTAADQLDTVAGKKRGEEIRKLAGKNKTSLDDYLQGK